MSLPAKNQAKDHRTRDFSGVEQFLAQRHLLPLPSSAAVRTLLRRAHGSAYSMFLWNQNLTRLPEQGRVYLAEFASDAIQVLPHALAGYRKSTALLMRSTVENVLRHVYFSDHPVEFVRATAGAWHARIRDLFEYMECHPSFHDSKSRFDAIASLKSVYGDLSRNVHAGAAPHMEMRKALISISFDNVIFQKQTEVLERCAASANFVLAVFHAQAFSRFPPAHRQIVLDTIPKAGKRVLAGL